MKLTDRIKKMEEEEKAKAAADDQAEATDESKPPLTIRSLGMKVDVLAEQMLGLTKLLSETLARPIELTKALPAKESVDSEMDDNIVNPKWRKIVDEVLGPDFGVNVSYPDKGGIIFKLIVPLGKSNAEDAYLAFYKVDIRSKALREGEGIDAIKLFCEHVKQNLLTKPKIKPL